MVPVFLLVDRRHIKNSITIEVAQMVDEFGVAARGYTGLCRRPRYGGYHPVSGTTSAALCPGIGGIREIA